MTEEQRDSAYWLWLREYLAETRALNCGPLRQTRLALLRTPQDLAKRMGVSSAAYSRLEKNEAMGTLRIDVLAKAASALDCDFIYILIPKHKDGDRPRDLSQLIWEEIWPEASQSPRVALAPEHLKARTLAAVAADLLRSAKYRRQKGWLKRSDRYAYGLRPRGLKRTNGGGQKNKIYQP